MRPYQFVIGAGVLIYIHTLITSMYYLLPVDDNNEKYVPGLRDIVSLLLNDVDQTEDCMTRCNLKPYLHSVLMPLCTKASIFHWVFYFLILNSTDSCVFFHTV